MNTRRVSVNLPADLLEGAMKVTGKDATDTLVEGLELIRRRGSYIKAMKLRGRLLLDIDPVTSRERLA